MRPEKFDLLAGKIRNWGRWGAEDQCGTLNHIDDAALMRAAAAIKTGKRYSVGIAINKNGPQDGSLRDNPIHLMSQIGTAMNDVSGDAGWSDDIMVLPLQAATQWDSLAHVFYEGKIYNGHSQYDTVTCQGAAKCGIEHRASPGLVSRGVLLDIARMKGVDILPADCAISVDDLNAACELQGVTIEPGDIVMVRTGHIRHFTMSNDRAAWGGSQAGLSHLCAEWLHEKSLAAVCADNLAVECIDYAEFPFSERPLPMHLLCIRDMGMPLGRIFDFEALSVACAADGRYTCMLAAPPLAITNGLGSPINPVVVR